MNIQKYDDYSSCAATATHTLTVLFSCYQMYFSIIADKFSQSPKYLNFFSFFRLSTALTACVVFGIKAICLLIDYLSGNRDLKSCKRDLLIGTGGIFIISSITHYIIYNFGHTHGVSSYNSDENINN